MTDLDLTEAYKAAYEAMTASDDATYRKSYTADQAVDAAAPLIERQVRERIAAEQAALRGQWQEPFRDLMFRNGYDVAVDACITIARGGAS